MNHYDPLDRLRTLRVRDAMNANVVTIASTATLCEAAQTLTESKASGAPVVDEAGRCVGVISAKDYLTREAEMCRRRLESTGVVSGASANDEVESVRDYMSSAVQTVSVDASLISAARIMCAEHIHRLVALNERAAPVGVITTLDVTSALVAFVDEERQALGKKENTQ